MSISILFWNRIVCGLITNYYKKKSIESSQARPYAFGGHGAEKADSGRRIKVAHCPLSSALGMVAAAGKHRIRRQITNCNFEFQLLVVHMCLSISIREKTNHHSHKKSHDTRRLCKSPSTKRYHMLKFQTHFTLNCGTLINRFCIFSLFHPSHLSHNQIFQKYTNIFDSI